MLADCDNSPSLTIQPFQPLTPFPFRHDDPVQRVQGPDLGGGEAIGGIARGTRRQIARRTEVAAQRIGEQTVFQSTGIRAWESACVVAMERTRLAVPFSAGAPATIPPKSSG